MSQSTYEIEAGVPKPQSEPAEVIAQRLVRYANVRLPDGKLLLPGDGAAEGRGLARRAAAGERIAGREAGPRASS
jgi:hypothetical protein